MVTRFAIVTLIFFFLSTIFVIQPLSFHVSLPLIGKRKVTIGLVTAPIMAIAILWASQCLGTTQIRNGIIGTDNIKPYNILILFISLAYMAITLDVTGILQAAAFWVSNKGGSSGCKLYFYLYVLLTLISIFVGNNSLILSVTVFLIHHTAATGLPPDAWLISGFAAANTASMVLIVGNPTNIIICEGLRINHTAFTAHTVLPFVACSVACYLVLMLQYQDEKHIPRKLNNSRQLDPREALRDPVSGVCGSICLIVVIVLSFVLQADVWKIVLPSAGGKFIFDICWDHFRYSTGMIPRFDESQPDGVAFADDPIGMAFRCAMPEEMRPTGALQSTPTLQRDENASGNEPERHESSTFPYLNNTLQRAPHPATPSGATTPGSILQPQHRLSLKYKELAAHFPTFFSTLPRLPFALVPFTFSQFILIEALEHQGWIDIFSQWLVIASNKEIVPVVWLVGVFGVILCNLSGTNIGAAILLTRIIRASDFPKSTARAAAVSLAVASNIGAVSFVFSASSVGLFWAAMLKDNEIRITQWKFATWNMLPLAAMTGAGLGVHATRYTPNVDPTV
ncbi:hypothetical protein EST38_g9936 [Candolleomyces aberdarensis]|uniref:Citrate transporter-like domain-containing protein n=1 Tax=Candolleomyces aberdarensis TaxID=2316362 RepID=A0A4Q2D8P2_9AGAR|nr:hypothetical protein EST38_g9936 [Candolleomyces aberdarensis]